MDWSHIIAQPWIVPGLIGAGAFLLGLLIPKKSGSSWFGAVVFFLPNLFLDVLDMVHTKKFKYYGLILALVCIEAFFAFRAATVYFDVLHTRMPLAEMAIVCVIVFVAVFLCGYMVATHGKLTFWSVCTMLFVIVHDWAGTIWMNYSQPATATTSATITAPDDPLKVVLTIGMCVLGLLPFIMGAWAEELRPQLEKELEEEVNAFTSMATRKIKRRAVERVLRLANHTNVVHLVRALPVGEFADFKQFVMPIIAPGTPYNLPDQPEDQPSDEHAETSQHETQKQVKLMGKKRSGEQSKSSQNDNQNQRKMTASPVAKNHAHESQGEGHKSSTRPTKNLSTDQQTDSQKPVSKTARRDAKIRQFAGSHPEFTHAKLAARFHVSVSTIARALSAQGSQPAANQQETPRLTDEEPAPNGHQNTQGRTTDKLATVSIADENDLLAQARQN